MVHRESNNTDSSQWEHNKKIIHLWEYELKRVRGTVYTQANTNKYRIT